MSLKNKQHTTHTYLPKFKLVKKSKKLFSGYRDISSFKNQLPLILKGRKLTYRNKWNSGRSPNGRIIFWTRSSLKKRSTKPTINYNLRSLKLGFISSIYISMLDDKPVALYQLSDGSYTNIKPTLNTKLFILTKMENLLGTLSKRTRLQNYLTFLYSHFVINPSFFILRQLPRNQLISLIELYPNKSIEYVRSPGSKAKMLKMDTRTNTSIIKLPSGVKKIFSIYSLASLGQVLLTDLKNKSNNKAGHYNIRGKKPIVRGVAMNPVDHPHGGRTKAIKYQRTPWGKTTKFK